jgi:ribosome-binding protein aMBF1 (putative translation factor)
MPKKYEEYEEDENIQQWSPIILKKEQILKKDNTEITIDQFIFLLREKRELLKLSQIQLNVKCKFPYKYTIRDIESKRTLPTALELKTINTILELNLNN